MSVGRKRTPVETRLRNGNPRKHAVPETIPVGGRVNPAAEPYPAPPSGLSAEARTVWREAVKMLVDAGVYAKGDAKVVEGMVALLVRLRQVRRELDEHVRHRQGMHRAWDKARRAGENAGPEPLPPFIVPSARGTTAHPLLAKEIELSTAVRHYLETAGLTPTTRSRLIGDDKNKPTRDDLRQRAREHAMEEARSKGITVVE